jgi:nucleotide-binding universal stress UspA family protein
MSGIRRILCPIDFSETSRHAVDQAIAIAGWYRARLSVLYVYSPPFMPVPGLPAPEDRVPQSERQRVRDEAAAFLQSFGVAALDDADIVVDVGQPAAVILEYAATSAAANLIVMGTHGAGGFEHLLLGSVTEKVLRRAPCPVLTVPPRAHATSRAPFTHVLCAVDFSEWSGAALELASSMAQESGAALDLLHVLEWPWDEPPPPVFAELPAQQAAALTEFRRYLVSSATSRLESLASNAVRDRCPITVHIAHGKPYVQLLRMAVDLDANLIVLGVHGRNPLDLAVFGSTTNQVVRRATCPVLTVRR